MPDPKLKAAMEEIKAVLHKHDIAAIVLLQSQTHGEHLYRIDPSWSAATLKDNGELRVRAKREDFPSQEAQKKVVTETVGMFAGFESMLTNAHGNMMAVLQMLGRHVEFINAMHKDG